MLPLSPRKGFVDEFVLIDGVTRTGKFALAHVVSSFEGMEYFQYHAVLETVLYLHRLGKISLETSRALAQSDFNLNTFDMIIGRGLNTRVHDLSCIGRAVNSDEFVKRAEEVDRDVLLARFLETKRIPVQINHEGLANGRSLFHIFPLVKIINIMREPAELIESWYKRGWGKRIGHDPAAGWITLAHPNGPIPWWAVDWADEYQELSEIDRCIKSVGTLVGMAEAELAALEPAAHSRILFVNFETLLTDPTTTISRIGKFLGREPLAGQEKILERERIPRTLETGHARLAQSRLEKLASVPMASLLADLCEAHGQFWAPLGTG